MDVISPQEFRPRNSEALASENAEEEESLSLTGLVQTSDNPDNMDEFSDNVQDSSLPRRSSSEPSDFFEFFTQTSFQTMSHAEDIIFCGKLIVSNPNPNPHTNQNHHQPLRRRSESMSELNNNNARNIISTRKSNKLIMRNSKSLDYQKLSGKSEKMLDIRRSLSAQTNTTNSSSEGSSLKDHQKVVPQQLRPRWYFWTFGIFKFPAEMALQDIKNRQVRRNPHPPGTSYSSGEKGRSSWDDLLRVLSCKDDASVPVVATSFNRIQHV